MAASLTGLQQRTYHRSSGATCKHTMSVVVPRILPAPSTAAPAAAVATPQLQQLLGRGCGTMWNQQHYCRRTTRLASATQHDLSTRVLENVAALAFKARLKECRRVDVQMSCDMGTLMAGRINSVKVIGEGWRSPLDLTAQVLEATVSEACLDYGAMLRQQRIVLTNVPVGTARVVFSARDFGSFLVHPLMTAAAARAVQDHAFAFSSEGVRIEAPSSAHRQGLVEIQGIWRGDGQRYTVQLVPVAGGVAMRRGLQAHCLPAGIGSRTSSARLIEDELTRFFNNLTLDLQGAQFSFLSLGVVPGSGFAGSLLELHLRLVVRKFPPLNVKF